MSAKQSDEKSNSNTLENKSPQGPGRYRSIIHKFLWLLLAEFWNREREEGTEKKQQRADEHLIAAAIDKMATYTGLLFIATLASVVTAVLTLCVLNNQLQEMRVEKRPWISFAEPPTIIKDLHIEPVSGRATATVGINLLFRLKNTGASPAVDTQILWKALMRPQFFPRS